MMGKSHVIVASTSALLVSTDPKVLLFAIPAAVVGSLVPDLDHKGSKLGRLLPLMSHPISNAFKHRTATHSILAMLIIYTACIYADSKDYAHTIYLYAFLVGFISHPVCDLLTKKGVQLFWPIGPFIRLLPFRTGGAIEGLLVFLLCSGIVCYVLNINGIIIGLDVDATKIKKLLSPV